MQQHFLPMHTPLRLVWLANRLQPHALLPFPLDRILNPDTRGIMIGPYGGINFNMHSGEFVLTENGIVCCTFDEGTGLGQWLAQKR